MLKDFTIRIYSLLLQSFQKQCYHFQTFSEFLKNPQSKIVILRHDIDLKKKQATVFAGLESELKIKATYYFRAVKYIFDPEIIKQVAALGHEIGYHYEDLSMAKGDHKKAIKLFERNLELFRQYYPVETICMHGKSLSKYDNKSIWNYYDFKHYCIIGEPYFSLNFDEFLYLTDTAQRWNGSHIAIRDKVKSRYNFSFKTTFDILNNIDRLPDKIMLTVHPDRWTDNPFEWYRINFTVALKNLIKKYMLKKR